MKSQFLFMCKDEHHHPRDSHFYSCTCIFTIASCLPILEISPNPKYQFIAILCILSICFCIGSRHHILSSKRKDDSSKPVSSFFKIIKFVQGYDTIAYIQANKTKKMCDSCILMSIPSLRKWFVCM